MAVERLIGIDFGTSTSVIRIKRYDSGAPVGEMLETKEVVFGGNGSVVPTLIMKKDDDPSVCYFGYEAQQKKKRFTNFHGFKMDLESSDPARQAQARQLTEEFFGYLARQYRNQSEGGHLGDPGDRERTVISYPVKWSQEIKTFMLETARKAGFPEVTGMDEAQAAIHAVTVMSADHLHRNGLLRSGVPANILLIDMGAGTTDLVLARHVPGVGGGTEVLTTWPRSGDIRFGGREIDMLLQDFFRDRLEEDEAEQLFRRIGPDKFKSWKEDTVSPALRSNDSVSDFEVLDSCADMMGIELGEYCLDRAAFEDRLAGYLGRFTELVEGCLRDAGVTGDAVDLVIVTGGHSQWYFVTDILAGRLPRLGEPDLPKIRRDPSRIISISRPQETVALGLVYSRLQPEAQPPQRPEAAPEAPAEPAETEKRPPSLEELAVSYIKSIPEEVLSRFSNTAHPALPELRRNLRVPENERIWVAKDSSLFGNGKVGTVITGTGIYVRADLEQPGKFGWEEFASSGIQLVEPQAMVKVTGSGRNIGYFLGCCVEAFGFYRGLQEHLRKAAGIREALPQPAPAPVPPQPAQQPTGGRWDGLTGMAQSAVDQVRQTAQQAAEQKRLRDREEALRRAATARLDLKQLPYTPESEFELTSMGENYVIRRYLGSSPIVSIPPVIRGRKVVMVGASAFGSFTLVQGNKKLEAVIIPETVHSIGQRAFTGCFSLHTVIAHPGIVEIGESAFWGCDKLEKLDMGMGDMPPGHVKFPPGLRKIGPLAFSKAISLTYATYLKEVLLSRRTVVQNPIGGKTFPPGDCALFYYD